MSTSYTISTQNSNITILEKLEKIEKYLNENKIYNIYTSNTTLTNNYFLKSSILNISNNTISQGDLILSSDAIVYNIVSVGDTQLFVDTENFVVLKGEQGDNNIESITIISNKKNFRYVISTSDGNITSNIVDFPLIIDDDNNIVSIIDLEDDTPTTSSISGYKNIVIGGNDVIADYYNIIIGRSSRILGSNGWSIILGNGNVLDNALGGDNILIGSSGRLVIESGSVEEGRTPSSCLIGEGELTEPDTFQFKDTKIVQNGKIAILEGGTDGQVLAKDGNNDYSYKWVSISGGSGEENYINNIESTETISLDVENGILKADIQENYKSLIDNAIQPQGTSGENNIVGTDNNNSPIYLSVGDGLTIENNTLKATQQGETTSSEFVEIFGINSFANVGSSFTISNNDEQTDYAFITNYDFEQLNNTSKYSVYIYFDESTNSVESTLVKYAFMNYDSTNGTITAQIEFQVSNSCTTTLTD